MCAPKKMAPTKEITSPMLNANCPLASDPANDVKAIPNNEINAPNKVFLDNGFLIMIHEINGTNTTFTAVKKEFFEVVVNSKPVVCKKYARNKIAPITLPLNKCVGLISFNRLAFKAIKIIKAIE